MLAVLELPAGAVNVIIVFSTDFILAVMIVVAGSMEVVFMFHHPMLEGWIATLALLVMLREVAAELNYRNTTCPVLKNLYRLLRFEAFVSHFSCGCLLICR